MRGQWWPIFWAHLFSPALEREEHANKHHLRVWGVLTVFQLNWVYPRSWRVCFHGLHFSGSRLLCPELSELDPGLRALPRSKRLKFRDSTKVQTRLGLVLCPSQVRASQVTRCLVSTVIPRWGVHLIASPVPAARFSRCTMGTPSQVCSVSLLGSWSLAATLPADVNHPESQEVLVSNEASLQFGRGCLSGATIAPFQLWLPLPACLQQGMGQSTAS